MRTFPFVAALATFISSTTFAAVLVFDNAEVFNAGLLDSSLANYGQTFESYSGSSAFFTGGSGDYAWKASSANGVLGQAGVIQTQVSPFMSQARLIQGYKILSLILLTRLETGPQIAEP